MSDKKVGDCVEFSTDRYSYTGARIMGGGEIIGFIGDFALIRKSDDILVAIETWRIK